MKEYLMCIYQNDPSKAIIEVKAIFRAFYPQQEAEHNFDLSYDWVNRTFGINPCHCNRYVFSYVASLLFQMTEYGVSYAEESDRRATRLSVTLSQVVVESYLRLFTGSTFKIPVTFSLVSIGNKRIIGVRASCFNISAIQETTVFMPISLQVYSEGIIEKAAEIVKSGFHVMMKSVFSTFLGITTDYCIESIVKGAEQFENFYSSQIIPFEHYVLSLKQKTHDTSTDSRFPPSPTNRQHYSFSTFQRIQQSAGRKPEKPQATKPNIYLTSHPTS